MEYKIVSNGNDLVRYWNNGIEHVVHYSDLQPYWQYATIEDQEGLSIQKQDSLLIGIMLTASAQGGIIFIWDCIENKLIHISEGNYIYDAKIYDDAVYGLGVVSNFVTNPHFVLTRCRIGCMDAFKEADVLDCCFECSVDEFDGRFESIELTRKKDEFNVILNGKVLDENRFEEVRHGKGIFRRVTA